MIIKQLRVEGFMRYELLELVDLPRGVIGLVGENEAGKTTVGEAVAFALFGRTIRTEGTDPTQAIHWEKDECRTRLDIELSGRGVHRIERRVARTGELEARLTGPDGAVLAEGLAETAERLHALTGLDFSTFRYSFYVAQHELDILQRDARENARRVVWDMLGITTVERARGLLQRDLDDLKEKASTLERDLLVTEAIQGELASVKDEVHAHQEQLADARVRHAEALTQDARARQARELAEKAAEAERGRNAALRDVEAALVVANERQSLLRSLRRLETLQGHAVGAVQRAEAAARNEDGPRKAAKEALDRAQAVDRAAQALVALVAARRDQLAHETGRDAGPDALPAREARELAAAAAWRRTATVRTVIAVVLLVLAASAAASGLGTRYPAGKPLLPVQARTLQFPSLGAQYELTPERAFQKLLALGGALALAGVAFLVARFRALSHAEAGDAEHARLAGLETAEKAELEACERFQLGTLDRVAEGLAAVGAANVREGLGRLQAAAGPELMTRERTPAQVLQDAQEAAAKVESGARGSDLALAEARRIEATARHALEEAREAIRGAYPEGVPQAASGLLTDAPATAQALDEEVQRTMAQAVRARVELEALGARAAPSVGEAAATLKASLQRAFEAHRGDTAHAKARYEEQSGLSELLRSRSEVPAPADLRAVVRRERELLAELLGDEATLRAARDQADAQARDAREELIEAQASLDEARLRGERVEAGRKRLGDLERKAGELAAVLGPTRREVERHGAATRLLDELSEHLKARFGPAIARYIERVLPALTAGRYRRVKVGPDLDIKVYSPDKGDFVRLIDLSTGTADQVLLALRLGLARALVGARGLGGGHFLFLDEPLVSADESREQAFLELLRTFDDEFAQVIVTSPRRMDEGLFAKTIELAREQRASSALGEPGVEAESVEAEAS